MTPCWHVAGRCFFHIPHDSVQLFARHTLPIPPVDTISPDSVILRNALIRRTEFWERVSIPAYPFFVHLAIVGMIAQCAAPEVWVLGRGRSESIGQCKETPAGMLESNTIMLFVSVKWLVACTLLLYWYLLIVCLAGTGDAGSLDPILVYSHPTSKQIYWRLCRPQCILGVSAYPEESIA